MTMEAASQFYGYTEDELSQMTIMELNPLPEDTIRREMARAREEQCKFFRFNHRLASGEVRDVEVYSSPIEVQGRILLHSIIHDVTERERAERERQSLEEQLQQSQKMESIGRLAGGVAHDFNNMLGVVLGNAGLAIEEVPPSHPVRESLQEIEMAARRSADLTRQLLAFARKQTISPRVLDLNQTVTEALKMLQRLIGEEIELFWRPSDGVWPVKVDPGQIEQVMANLAVNARDAIQGVGSITIESQNASLRDSRYAKRVGAKPGEYAMLSLRDSGCGIEPATLKYVFEPFFTTKEAGQGTGLGLATVYGIVKQNNGYIEVESEPGQGSVFKIYLPRYEEEEEAHQAEATVRSEVHGHETVLLVEDEPSLLKLSQDLLRRLGYHVLSACVPGEALEVAEKYPGPIHLLLTDVVMPEMNGRDLATKLQENRPTLRHLFMSGYTADVIAHRGVLNEGVHFIQKPFTKTALAAKIREVLRHPLLQGR